MSSLIAVCTEGSQLLHFSRGSIPLLSELWLFPSLSRSSVSECYVLLSPCLCMQVRLSDDLQKAPQPGKSLELSKQPAQHKRICFAVQLLLAEGMLSDSLAYVHASYSCRKDPLPLPSLPKTSSRACWACTWAATPSASWATEQSTHCPRRNRPLCPRGRGPASRKGNSTANLKGSSTVAPRCSSGTTSLSIRTSRSISSTPTTSRRIIPTNHNSSTARHGGSSPATLLQPFPRNLQCAPTPRTRPPASLQSCLMHSGMVPRRFPGMGQPQDQHLIGLSWVQTAKRPQGPSSISVQAIKLLTCLA